MALRALPERPDLEQLRRQARELRGAHRAGLRPAAWMRAHCPVDLDDAVCFDLPEHVEARLAEDPGSVDRAIDQWHVPWSTSLYWSAYLGRTHLARRLLDGGADPARLAGDGRSALDIAEEKGHTETAALLREHAARRAEGS